MKKLRLSLLARWNVILASLIALLGIGCKNQKQTTNNIPKEDTNMIEEELVCMYGVPRAFYNTSGTVKNPAGKPLAGIDVHMQTNHGDCVARTDKDGHFNIQVDAFPIDTLVLHIIDPTGKYEPNTVQIPATYTGGDGKWNVGSLIENVSVILQPKVEMPLLKYGVPYVRMGEEVGE